MAEIAKSEKITFSKSTPPYQSEILTNLISILQKPQDSINHQDSTSSGSSINTLETTHTNTRTQTHTHTHTHMGHMDQDGKKVDEMSLFF